MCGIQSASLSVAMQPLHISRGTVFDPTYRGRFELNAHTASQAVMHCSTFWASSYPLVAYRVRCRLHVTGSFSDLRSAAYQTRNVSYTLLSLLCGTAFPVYTDESLEQGSTGCAFICGEQIFSYRLHSLSIVYSACAVNLMAALAVLKRITKLPRSRHCLFGLALRHIRLCG
jgi:hypothetical protein